MVHVAKSAAIAEAPGGVGGGVGVGNGGQSGGVVPRPAPPLWLVAVPGALASALPASETRGKRVPGKMLNAVGSGAFVMGLPGSGGTSSSPAITMPVGSNA